MKRRRTAKEKNADEEGTDSAAAANRFSTFINEEEVIKAVHSSVINTSEDLKKDIQISHSKDIQFSKEVLSKISGLIFDIVTTHWTSDLLAFSKHGSRQNCNNDDVLLLARRNEALLATLMSESVGSVHNSPKGKQKTSKESDDITVLPTPSSTPFLPPERRVSAISSDLDMDIELGLKTPSALPSHSGGVTPLAASTPYKGGSLKKSGPGLSCITPIASKVNKRAAVLSYIAECEEMIEETTPLPPDVLPVIERTESSFTRNNLSPSPSQISSFERILENQQEHPQSPQNADDSFDVFQETPHKSAPQSKAEDSFEDDDFVQKTGSCQNKTAPRRNLLSASTMVPGSQKPLTTPVGDVEDPWQNNFAQFSFETLDMKEKPKTQHVNKQASKTSSPFSFSQDSFDAESSKRVFSTTTSNKKNEPPNKTRRSNIPISDLMNSFIDDDTDFIGLDSLI